MSIMQRQTAFDAAGRCFDPRGVVYTVVDMQGFFIDAVLREDPPDAEILRFHREVPNGPLCAVIRNKKTGICSLYGIDLETQAPYLIHKGRRPWHTRDFKLRRMEMRWRNRYGDGDIC